MLLLKFFPIYESYPHFLFYIVLFQINIYGDTYLSLLLNFKSRVFKEFAEEIEEGLLKVKEIMKRAPYPFGNTYLAYYHLRKHSHLLYSCKYPNAELVYLEELMFDYFIQTPLDLFQYIDPLLHPPRIPIQCRKLLKNRVLVGFARTRKRKLIIATMYIIDFTINKLML